MRETKNIPQYIADPQYVEGTLLRVEGFSYVSDAQFLNPETLRARVEIEDRATVVRTATP